MGCRSREEHKPKVIDISVLQCVCGGLPTFYKLGTTTAGMVHQISCACGTGVHGRTLKKAQSLWNRLQESLHTLSDAEWKDEFHWEPKDEDDGNQTSYWRGLVLKAWAQNRTEANGHWHWRVKRREDSVAIGTAKTLQDARGLCEEAAQRHFYGKAKKENNDEQKS